MLSIKHTKFLLRDLLFIATKKCNAEASLASTLHSIMHSSKDSRMTLLWWLMNE